MMRVEDDAQQLADALAGVGARVTITEEEFEKYTLTRPQLICQKLREAGVPTHVEGDMEMFRQIKVKRGRLDVTTIKGGNGLEYTWLL